jgi:dienelactone hydrolase
MRSAAALALLLLLATAGHAGLREEQLDLPVEVSNAFGKLLRGTIKVTVFSDDDTPRPAPLMVLNHGRSAESQQRAAMGRVRYLEASRFFVSQGFIVAVPTRMGYGVSGGEDVESTGGCERKNYPAGYAAATQQTLAVLERLRQRQDAAQDRAVVVGQSFGGATAAAVAALNPAGVQASINFAGGGGGNPKTQPRRPCAPQQLERMFRGYGRTAKVPMLWIYTENDMYMGPKHPKEWFDAYVAEGAPAEFVHFPPHGEDGHLLFTRHPEAWKPTVSRFLQAHGFQPPAPKGL